MKRGGDFSTEEGGVCNIVFLVFVRVFVLFVVHCKRNIILGKER